MVVCGPVTPHDICMSDSPPWRDMHEQNRRSWDHATRAHNSHKGDQAAFFRDGGNRLYPEERALLGDLAGKRVLHLQCNSGQDTLSLAALGADATGVDISGEAIEFARRLAHDSGIPATFVRADVYDWLAEAATGAPRWDIVFRSYGALVWLSDLDAWAQGIAAVLVPGGRFVAVEFHPAFGMTEADWSLRYPYFNGEPLRFGEGIGDYVADSGEGLAVAGYEEGVVGFKNPEPVYEFTWAPSEVITALLGAGLVLDSFTEYPYANGWRAYPGMRVEGDRVYPPAHIPPFPMMYSLSAHRPA